MKIFLASTLTVLFVAFGAAGAWAQGNSCEENIDAGNGGCGINPVAVTHGAGVGGIQLGGTQFDNTCATGTGGCLVNQPMMRFWIQGGFDNANSGSHGQSNTGVEWMVNPVNDFGFGTDAGVWIFFQANWANSGVQGCPSTDRVVGEVSFCDGARSYYVLGSLAGPGPYDFDNIDDGAGGAMMMSRVVPEPAANTTGVADTPAGFCTVTFDLTGNPQWYTENGSNDPANVLVAGYEVVYYTGAAAPSGCSTGYGAWAPLLDGTGAANLGVIAPGTGLTGTVPMPGATDMVYLSARVIYADGACTGVGCDPQGMVVPASCFSYVSAAISCGGGTPVSWESYNVERTSAGVLATWKTFEEVDTFGFKVMRAAAGTSNFEQVGPVILAKGPGFSYSYTDTTAARGEGYEYKIVEVAFSGTPTQTPPMSINAITGGAQRLRLYTMN